MSKTWKWILGIALALALLGGLFAIGYFWRGNVYGYSGMMPGMHGQYQQFNPGPGERGWQHPMFDERYSHGRMMQGGYHPMGGGFFPLGGLARFALFVGLLYGAYWLGRRNARITLDPSTGSGQAPKPAAPVSAPPASEPAPPSTPDES